MTFESISLRPAAFHIFSQPLRMPRQSLILLLEYLMQSSPVLAKIRQRQCLLSPKPAQHILRSTIEIYRTIECRCCKPFEFFGWIRPGLLQGGHCISVRSSEFCVKVESQTFLESSAIVRAWSRSCIAMSISERANEKRHLIHRESCSGPPSLSCQVMLIICCKGVSI